MKYRPIEFPIDELSHNCIVEWWYFNGHLRDKQGKDYSFMDCLFKVDVKKAKIPFLVTPLKISYFSHSLISDIKQNTFKHRIAPFSFISGDSFSRPELYINYINPSFKNRYINCLIERLDKRTLHIKNEDLDLLMTANKKPLLECGRGFFSFMNKSTFYYSLTNLSTLGKIKIDNQWVEVTGKSWMDHQWANGSYSKDRWDWFSIQLENNIELVCFACGPENTKFYSADIIYSNNKQEHFSDVKIIPGKKIWQSKKSKARYPLSWTIKIPKKNIILKLNAKINNQEMLFGSINYWEGPLSISGFFDNKPIKGVGFMELVGYPSNYNGIKYIKDGIKRVTFDLVSNTKKKNYFNVL